MFSGKTKTPILDLNDFKSQVDDIKPRERMEEAGTASVLCPIELLMIILKTGSRGCDVGELSKRLVNAFGGVDKLVRCDLLEIQQKVETYNHDNPNLKISGLGRVKMLELAAAFELVRRGYGEPSRTERTAIGSAKLAYNEFRKSIPKDAECEYFMLLPLNTKRIPLCDAVTISLGTINSTQISPREVFKLSLKWNASSIIVAHNHPSGDLTPSQEDLLTTRNLLKVAHIMGIPLLDHLILGPAKNSFLSMATETTLPFSS